MPTIRKVRRRMKSWRKSDLAHFSSRRRWPPRLFSQQTAVTSNSHKRETRKTPNSFFVRGKDQTQTVPLPVYRSLTNHSFAFGVYNCVNNINNACAIKKQWRMLNVERPKRFVTVCFNRMLHFVKRLPGSPETAWVTSAHTKEGNRNSL